LLEEHMSPEYIEIEETLDIVLNTHSSGSYDEIQEVSDVDSSMSPAKAIKSNSSEDR